MSEMPRFLQDVCGAWDMLTDIPLPATFSEDDKTASDDGKILPWFPVLGALCGTAIAALGLLAATLTNRTAGATIFALLSLGFLLLKDSGRGILLIVSLVDRRLACGSLTTALKQISADRSILAETRFGGALAVVLSILEFLVLFLLASHGSAFFLVMVLTGSFAVQGMLAAAVGTAGEALIADEEHRGRNWLLALTAVVALAMLWRFPVATAFSVAAGVAAFSFFGGFVRSECAGPEPELVTLSGFLTEFALLVCGFLWAL